MVLAPVQLSVPTGAIQVAVLAQELVAVFTATLLGQVILGGMLSDTVTVNTQVGVPQVFVAVTVTIVLPLLKLLPLPVPEPPPGVAPVKA